MNEFNLKYYVTGPFGSKTLIKLKLEQDDKVSRERAILSPIEGNIKFKDQLVAEGRTVVIRNGEKFKIQNRGPTPAEAELRLEIFSKGAPKLTIIRPICMVKIPWKAEKGVTKPRRNRVAKERRIKPVTNITPYISSLFTKPCTLVPRK